VREEWPLFGIAYNILHSDVTFDALNRVLFLNGFTFAAIVDNQQRLFAQFEFFA
jgi:hypothetical protein